MTHVVIVGDTHVPSREPSIPDWVRDRMRSADHVIHVGDYDSPETLATVRDLAGDLTAVRGNMDPPAIDLPAVEILDVDAVRFVVTHGTGAPAGWADRVVETTTEYRGTGTTIGVAGHTHQVVDQEYDGVRLLNPGSAAGAAPADVESGLSVTVTDESVDVSVEWGEQPGSVHRG